MIEASGLTRRYGARLAVADVSFRVAPGELLALVGDSGSGKTTTLKMINRLVRPDAGRVAVEGRDVAGVEAHLLRRSIGYVFQGVGLFPHLTAAENVAVPLRLAGWPRADIERRVAEVLALAELAPPLGSRFPSALSGGEQQRVGVARALAASPRVMLLDEPFGALDPLTRERLQVSFDSLRRRLALSAVLVTHDMAEAIVLGDRIGIMRSGRLVQLGTPAQIARAPADEEVARLIDSPRRHAQLVGERMAARAARETDRTP